jgi:putative component of membrane protein insertase Oxa1/YidC/SpoIIIJ protein YidD
MQIRQVFAVSAFAIALPLASVSAQSTAPESGKWSFSLGVDPTNFDLHPPEPGAGVQVRMVANLTRSWQSANSKWTRHISLMVGADASRQVQPFGPSGGVYGPTCDCPMRVSRRYAGLTAGLSYDVFRVSRFTPYITGGTGFYVNGYRRSPVNEVLTPAEIPLYLNGADSHDAFSLGVNGGVGLKIRIGSRELFLEQKVHQFDISQPGVGVNPFSIGIRF